MGSKEYAQPVRGSGQQPVSTSVNGSIETNNYTLGEAFSVGDGTNTYPYTVNPVETMQEVSVFSIGSGIVMDITTKTGDTINGVEPMGSNYVIDTIEIDSVTFRDPDATGAATKGMWVGE